MSTKVDDFNAKWTLANDSGKRFKVYFDPDGWTIPYFENYDYYLNVTLTNMTSQIKINDIAVIRKSSAGTEVNMSISDKIFGVSTYGNNMGYYVTCKLNALDVNSTIASLNLVFDNTYSVGNEVRICYIVYAVPKSAGATSSDISALIQAINNQTTTLNGSIGNVNSSVQSGTSQITGSVEQGASDIQNKIEEQYDMSANEDFGIGSIENKYNEKMGVLSFGSDVMLQFLDMFQTANVGTARLTLPGFTIKVQNQNYKVWDDITFNFEQIGEWFPDLISIIRVILPAFVWLMVLRYCINVFEKNFLSSGG